MTVSGEEKELKWFKGITGKEKNFMESNSMKSTRTIIKRTLCYVLTAAMVISGFNMIPGMTIKAKAASANWNFVELEDGRYKISPASAPGLALDKYGGIGSMSETNVQVHTDNGTAAQRWILKNQGNKTYKIQWQGNDSYMLDIGGHSSDLGSTDTNVVIWTGTEKPSLENTNAFKIGKYSQNNVDGYFIYCGTNGSTDYVFDIEGGIVVTGKNVQAHELLGNANQLWQFIPITYTVKYDSNGGSGYMADQEIQFDKATKLSKNLYTKSGYTFAGWTTDAAGTTPATPYTEQAEVTNLTQTEGGSVTLYAKWTKNSSKITFDKNATDATAGTTSIEVANGGVVADIIVPTRSGWIFDGYCIGDTDIKLFDKNGSIVKSVTDYTDDDGKWISSIDVTLKAVWTKTNGNVTFSNKIEQDFFEKNAATPVTAYNNVPEAKEIVADTEVSTITAFDIAAVPTRTGYTFAGFADELSGGTEVFNADGKIADENITSKLNGKIVEDGKWVYPGAITLYAQWIPNEYTLIFDKNKGEGNDVTINGNFTNGYPKKVTIKNQKMLDKALIGFATKADPGAEGYELVYSVSKDDINEFILNDDIPESFKTYPNSDAVTLYAVWSDETYNIAYYDRDWTIIAEENATVDKNATTRIGEYQTATAGQFMLKSLVELDDNYNPGEHATKYYDFIGWSTIPYDTEAQYVPGKQYQGMIAHEYGKNVNLYAVWVKKAGAGADISFNGNGSFDAPATNIPADDEVVFDEVDENGKYANYKIESAYQPVRKGYTFLGWSKKATETNEENIYNPGTSGINVKIYEDTVFYAQWKINPLVSYDVNGGEFAEDKEIKAERYPSGTTILVVNPRTESMISRVGYTFVGWTSNIDSTVYSSGTSTIINPSFTMPEKDVVFKAKWQKNVYDQNVIADIGPDVYSVSYTGTYNNDGEITKLEGTNEKIDVPLSYDTNTGKYTGAMASIPHDASVVLTVKVSSEYKADDVKVEINGAVYKPTSTTVESVLPDVAEDGKGKTVFTFKVENITSNDFSVNISNAALKQYNIKYVSTIGTIPDTITSSYSAGSDITLDDLTETDQYSFKGWYKTAEDAKELNDSAKITAIPTTARGDKTFYAGWEGKKYKVTFNKLKGTTKAIGAAEDADSQELTYGTETALKTFAEAFPETIGPNGVEFLGWAKSEKDAFDHKVAYTDGQIVKDIANGDITLWAVWDIDELTISFNANGGKFGGTKLSVTKTIKYGDTLAEAVAEVNSSKPSYTGYTFNGWAKENDAVTYITTHDEPLYNDAVYYTVWQPDQHTFRYYKNSDGGDEAAEITTYNGKNIIIGKAGNGLETDEDVVPTVPENKVLLGWTPANPNPDNTVTYAVGEKITVSPTSGTNLYPVFGDGNQHILTYNSNGGKIVPAPDATYLTKDVDGYKTKVISTIPTREGYEFVGWSEDENAKADSTDIVESGGYYTYVVPTEGVVYSHTLYAVWTPIKYTITYNANKAPEVAAAIVNKVAADATVPALKETLDDGLVAVEGTTSYKQTFTYDETSKIAAPQFEYPGYIFMGWAESETGNVVYKNLQDILNMTDVDGTNFTVYAVWKMDTPLTVTYRANGGILKTAEEGADPYVDPEDQKYVRIADKIQVTTADNVYIRDGYKFLGWSASPDNYGYKDVVPESGIIEAGKAYDQEDVNKTSTVTLYAVWQKLPEFKIVYDPNTGSGSVPFDNNTYHIDTDATTTHNVVTLDASVIPGKTGYTFLGWALKADSETPDYKYIVATGTDAARIDPATEAIPETLITDETAETNTIKLYAIWKANTYKVNFYQGAKAEANKIGEQEFKYDDKEGKLTKVADLKYVVTEGEDANAYKPTPGYEFAGWAFKNGGTLALEDGSAIENLVTGADEETSTFDLYAVEKEKILQVTFDDDFNGIGENFLEDKEFFDTGWGKASVLIKDRAADDVVAIDESSEDVLEKTGIDNTNHKYLVKYTRALNDITIPEAPGFTFKGYYATVPDTSAGATKEVMYYDASGNAVRTADFTEPITLKAKWEATTFDVVFKEDGNQIDKFNMTYGQKFVMPNTVKGLSYKSDYEVVGWTSSVDNQHPETADIANMSGTTKPDKFDLNKTYSAVIIAKLYNNYNADVTLYPIYKTTVEYNVYFSAEGATNVPETQKIKWEDDFVISFDDDSVMKTPKMTGYAFIGWSKTKDAKEAEYAYESGKTYKIEKVKDDFTLYAVWLQIPDIKAIEKTVKYTKEGWDITELFVVPDGAGKATYKLADGTTGAVLSEDGKLTATTIGTYVIEITTAETEGFTAGMAEAKLTVEKAEGDGTLTITDGKDEITEIAFADAAKVEPVIAITSGDKKLDELGEITYEYKLITSGDDAYTTEKPVDAGEYIVRATVKDGDLYTGFTKTATYTISDKLRADGVVKTYKDDEEATEFVEDKDTISVNIEITSPTESEDADYKPVVEYSYKVAGTSDETYTDKVPTKVGEYTVRAIVGDTAKYVGFTVTANFKIIENSDKAEAEAKKAEVTKAEADVLKRLQDVYDTLKNSNNYTEGQLAALDAAYNTAKADLKKKVTETIANDAEITSEGVAAAAEKALTTAKEALLEAVKTTAANEAADKVVEDANKDATAVLEKAGPIVADTEYTKYIKDDVDKVIEAMAAVDTAKTDLAGLPADASNDDKEEKAKALQDAVEALDKVVDDAILHAAIAEAVMNQENIQPFVKNVAKDSLAEYVERIKPDGLTEEEKTAYDAVVEAAKKAIEDAKNNEDVLGNLESGKKAVKAAAELINETRAAEAAKAEAGTASTLAEQAAADAKANEYASENDKQNIDSAKSDLETAKAALEAATTNEEKIAAAAAVDAAVKALDEEVNKANQNSAAAKKDADEAAEAKAKAEEEKAATAKALDDAKKAAKSRLEDVYDAKNKSDYRDAQQKALDAAKEAGAKAIDAATTPEEVDKALANAKSALNAVKTDAKLTKEEQEAAKKKAAEDAAKKKAAEEAAKKKAEEEAAKQPKIDPNKETFYTLFLRTTRVTKNSITLSWSKVDGATKYTVYGGSYGTKIRSIVTLSGNKNTRKKLKAGKLYNYYVVAYNAKGEALCTSAKIYVSTKGGKYTNYKSVTTVAKGNKVYLAKGETFNLGAKATVANKKLVINKKRKIKYISTNTKIAKVSSKGTITAVAKGTCFVYVYAQNGVYKKIKVTVE